MHNTSYKHISIVKYEPWMRDQIVSMFNKQYGLQESILSDFQTAFYEHQYQDNRALRFVALIEDKVAGFQSYFYWPYLFGDKMINVYQSGGSIVHESFRGQGIFNSILARMDDYIQDSKIDLLIGFPLKTSYNNFIKNGWENILNLRCYVRAGSPFSFFKNNHISCINFEREAREIPRSNPEEKIVLMNDLSFQKWRDNYKNPQHYFYYYFSRKSMQLRFDIKIKVRGKIKELIIGRLITNSFNSNFLNEAVKSFVTSALSSCAFTVISVVLNERFYHKEILNAFKCAGFRKTWKKIIFIIKNLKMDTCLSKPELWELYRSDMDTW